MVPAVVVPAEAEALDSDGCRLLLPAMVHVDLYSCLWRAAAHNLQRVHPVWASAWGWRRWTIAGINCYVR